MPLDDYTRKVVEWRRRGFLHTYEFVKMLTPRVGNGIPRGEWTVGDSMNTAVGQGEVLVTPLQLANTYATFANGGIGDQDLKRMHLLAPRFPLHILLATHPNGEFLAKVPVTIRDQQGNTVFEISDAGPLLYVNLPDGHYQITATVAGMAQTRNITLHSHAAREVDFYWPQAAA